VLGEHREDHVVGLGQSGVLKQVSVHTCSEVMTRVPEGAPGAILLGREPVRFRRHSLNLSLVDHSTNFPVFSLRCHLLP
jgi:hypothetical protein